MTSNAMAFMRSGRFRVTRATCGCGAETSTNVMVGIVDRAGPAICYLAPRCFENSVWDMKRSRAARASQE